MNGNNKNTKKKVRKIPNQVSESSDNDENPYAIPVNHTQKVGLFSRNIFK